MLFEWVQSNLPESLRQAFLYFIALSVWSWIGRMMWHVSEVQKKRRAFWSKHLLWELLMALCIGFVADGVVSYLGVTGKPATAVVVAIAYLGPRGIETFILAGLQRWKISSRGKSQSGE